jgi:ketosteroid isomerase-like protein
MDELAWATRQSLVTSRGGREAWDDWTVDVERIVEAGSDQVILFMQERGRSASGSTMDERHAELYTLRDAKIVRRQGFSDPNQALEAAGLSE